MTARRPRVSAEKRKMVKKFERMMRKRIPT